MRPVFPETVDPAVENWICAGGGHCEQVGEEEGEVIIRPAVHRDPEVFNDIEKMDGSPAGQEEQQHHKKSHAGVSLSGSLGKPPSHDLRSAEL